MLKATPCLQDRNGKKIVGLASRDIAVIAAISRLCSAISWLAKSIHTYWNHRPVEVDQEEFCYISSLLVLVKKAGLEGAKGSGVFEHLMTLPPGFEVVQGSRGVRLLVFEHLQQISIFRFRRAVGSQRSRAISRPVRDVAAR